jgi:ubiquinone/menaquinone biosynthesis C-methylase UbiE
MIRSPLRRAYHLQMTGERRYLPAASLDIFLPAYDPIMALLGFRRALLPLLAQAELEPHHSVLDIGCGTGTLAILIKQSHPTVNVTGVDPDSRALARATRKASRARVTATFDRGFADALPYADGTFDRVLSSMMFHHVPKEEKPSVLAEVRRVLKPGGRLHLLDFAGGTHSVLAQALHGRQASASANDRLLARMREAGLADAIRTATHGTFFGAIAYYQASAVPAGYES